MHETSRGNGGRAGSRKSVVLAHSSDLHIDDEVVKGPDNGLVGLGLVFDAARRAAADVILLAGDTFDNLRVSQTILTAAVDLLASAPVPVVLLPGNHDPSLDDCLYRRSGLCDMTSIHVVGISQAEPIVFEDLDLEILGVPHKSYGDMPPLSPARRRGARWQVVMAHGHYVPLAEWEEQSHRSWRISDAALAATGADYIALGHWDRPSRVGDGTVAAYYSGSPDLAKTINVVRLDEAVGVTVARAPIR